MVTHVFPARAKRWREVAWKTPPTRPGVGYVARRVKTAGPKDGNYESQPPAMGTPLRMRMGGVAKLLYKSGQRAGREQLEVGRWRGRLGGEAGRGSWGRKLGEEAEEELSEGGGGREEKRRRRRRTELSRASSQRGDEFVCPRIRLRPGLRNWERGLERHSWKWEVAALGP